MIRIVSLIFTLVLLTAALPSFSQYKFDNKKAEKLYNKLETYYENYEYDKILKNEAAITSSFLNKKDTLAALMYSFLGEAYMYQLNDMPKSLSFYDKELALRRELGDKNIRELIFNIGYIKDELGQYNETEVLFLELLQLESKEFGEKSEEYAFSALSLLDHYMRVEQTEKGLEFGKRLSKIVQRNSLNEAMTLKQMGDLYQISGNFSKSEKNLAEALSILNDLGMYASIEYASTLVSLAGLYNQIGKIPQAEEVYTEAKSILERLQGDQDEFKMIVSGNLALNYTSLGNFDKAEKLYLEVMAFDKAYYGEGTYPVAVDAGNLADSYKKSGKLSKAEEYYKISGDIYKSIVGEESTEYGRILQNLAYINMKKGNIAIAKTYGQQALATFQKTTKNKVQLAVANFNLGEVYLGNDELEEAEKYHLAALDLIKKGVGENHPDYAKSTTQLAILNWRKKDYKTALSYYKETFDNYFKQIDMVFPILSEEEKTKFYYNKLKPAFEQYNSFIIETSSEDKSLIGEMYNNQLATKGLILYASGKVRKAIMSSGDSLLIDKYNTWITQKEQLAKLFSSSTLPVDERNKLIDSLNVASNNLEKELSKSSDAFSSTLANKNLTWQAVQKKLKPGEAAVETIRFRDFSTDSAGIFTDEVYYAALIVTGATTENPDLVVMRNGKLMETKYLSNYRNAIKYKVDEDYSYRLFWKPIANKLEGIKKVYFSPDGVFNQISIYTLRNPATGNFTIDELEIQVLNNTKDLLAVNSVGKSSGMSYLYGYPNYNMGVIDEAKESGKDSNKAAQEAAKAASENRGRGMSRGGERGVRGADDDNSLTRGGAIPRGLRGNMLRYMRSNQLLSLLPGTKKEVNLIDSLYQRENAEVTKILSNEALEESIKKVNSPKTLHIATHGFFLEHDKTDETADSYVENPLLRSGLILAGANSFISSGVVSEKKQFEEDGILTAYEAMNLNLENTELVVLSACETGLGEVKNGEGVYGLQRAFQVAGAQTMIMSMWTVDDDATQELMTVFYEEWLNGKTKQEAFIAAQKRIKDKWKSPYYWGAFVMVGQ